MRTRIFAVVVIAAAITVPASASSIDPQALVIRQSDLPAGFVVDRHESGATPNKLYTSPAGVPKLVVRSGRITGYRRFFGHRESRVKVIQSQVDLFRKLEGARSFLAWIDSEERRHNARRGVINAYGRQAAGIGVESWVYWSGYPGYYVLVAWRHDRVLGLTSSWKVGREGTMKLARVQQRRIAAALG